MKTDEPINLMEEIEAEEAQRRADMLGMLIFAMSGGLVGFLIGWIIRGWIG